LFENTAFGAELAACPPRTIQLGKIVPLEPRLQTTLKRFFCHFPIEGLSV
jgi:hypothetical protein